MSFHHQFLTVTRPIQKVIRQIGCNLGFVSLDRIRVLLYHDVPVDEEDSFYKQLTWLKKDWNILTPLQFEQMMSGKIPIIGNNLLITFDDGMLSNLAVAEKILKKLDIKAIFFVINEFIKIKDPIEARQFASECLIPGSSLNDIPKTWCNLQWGDLKNLIKQGHTIGHHTKMHSRLSNCNSKGDLEEEIITSAREIELKLGIEVKHFAYTFGDINSFSKEAMLIAKSKFSFIHSGLRGDNSVHTSPLAIRRDAAATQFQCEYKILNNKLLSAFLDGFADFKYKSSLKKLDSWVK
jgi:peptidoglycan/xylan/chitin deacetylase (PgdA/CDA1 family)